jgi:transcriptional regulator with XRE-family HTH domain
MPSEVDLRLGPLLKEKAPGMTQARLAKRLGISKATLHGYLENRWTVLDRTVLEQMADFFECHVGSLLVTRETRFFRPFHIVPKNENHPIQPICLCLCRPDANEEMLGRAVSHRDRLAINQVSELLGNHDVVIREDTATTDVAFSQSVKQNCVVLGSPMVNPASEMAICWAFGVKPFDASQRDKLPFSFRVLGATEPPVSSIQERSQGPKRGIWLRKSEELVEVDYWPREEFKKRHIIEGRDCGLVIALNHRLTDQPEVWRKLIVLAGFSGVGTEAAGQALLDHYRDLEPREGDKLVWGVVEAFYDKPGDDMRRELLGYAWRCRIGGRCPINSGKRQS